jgi:hypothetical protein
LRISRFGSAIVGFGHGGPHGSLAANTDLMPHPTAGSGRVNRQRDPDGKDLRPLGADARGLDVA